MYIQVITVAYIPYFELNIVYHLLEITTIYFLIDT